MSLSTPGTAPASTSYVHTHDPMALISATVRLTSTSASFEANVLLPSVGGRVTPMKERSTGFRLRILLLNHSLASCRWVTEPGCLAAGRSDEPDDREPQGHSGIATVGRNSPRDRTSLQSAN